MPFPFTIRYRKPLRAIITPANQRKVAEYIKDRLLEHKADNIAIDDKLVSYKGTTSTYRTSLCGSVDKGTFRLDYGINGWYLVYEIRMYWQFLLAALIALPAGILSQSWWAGVLLFFLYGITWMVNLLRHDTVASKLAVGIDELPFTQKDNVYRY